MRPSFMIALLLSAAVLSGCATAYQSVGFMGGFSETQLSENVYRVRFNGNGFTSAERASDFALLRSSGLCLKAGYQYFIVSDAESWQELSEYTTPTQSQTYGQGNVMGGQRLCFLDYYDDGRSNVRDIEARPLYARSILQDAAGELRVRLRG